MPQANAVEGQNKRAPIISNYARIQPVVGSGGMVATANAEASQIGVEVLRRGGNAVDAAVAIGFALAVTTPRAGNLGGGGFMLVHNAAHNATQAIDYREQAPHLATADMFLDFSGEVDTDSVRYSYKSAGVPGSVKGFEFAHKLYGKLPWSELLQPAINLASDGFVVDEDLAKGLLKSKDYLYKSEAARKVFFKEHGIPYQVGDRLYQKDLAHSISLIAENGSDAFYTGEIADKIVADMQTNGGLITKNDLLDYRARLRKPVEGYYRGYKVVSMPPPSSGGVHLIQMLKLLSGFPLGEWGAGAANTIHVMAEAMRLAYADRSKYLGDPDFVSIPQKSLMSDLYARRLRKSISLGTTVPSEFVEPGKFLPQESRQTTHFTIVDKWGNVVTNTYTLNFSFGSGHMVAGTGILLNNEMDDFTAKIGAMNAYGLIGGEANAIEPRKRPLSSMTPTLVFDENDQFFLATGTPGGSRIISTTLQIISNVIDHNMNIAEATMAPRMHHQWLPDELRVEKGFSPDTLSLLENKGHKVVEKRVMGNVQSIMAVDDKLVGFSDTRRLGGSTIASNAAALDDSYGDFAPLESSPLLQDLLREYEEINSIPE